MAVVLMQWKGERSRKSGPWCPTEDVAVAIQILMGLYEAEWIGQVVILLHSPSALQGVRCNAEIGACSKGELFYLADCSEELVNA